MALPTFRTWFLQNNDKFKLIQGQFEAQNVRESRGAVYSERFTLNRQRAITQFLHGQTPTLSFRGKFYNETILGSFPIPGDVSKNLEELLTWVERDPDLGRPPVLTFWIGAGNLSMDCLIESIDLDHDPLGFLGRYRGASFTVNLRRYDAFDPNATANFDTRYARARFGDYYELLAWNEYRDPLLGVEIRRRHPEQINLQPAQIVKLPSREGLRRVVIEPKSHIFKAAFDPRSTPQKERRLDMFKRRNKVQVSHINPHG